MVVCPCSGALENKCQKDEADSELCNSFGSNTQSHIPFGSTIKSDMYSLPKTLQVLSSILRCSCCH